jgi:hypothetical protein
VLWERTGDHAEALPKTTMNPSKQSIFSNAKSLIESLTMLRMEEQNDPASARNRQPSRIPEKNIATPTVKVIIHRDSERIAARIEATGGKDDWDIVGGSSVPKIQQMKTRRPKY